MSPRTVGALAQCPTGNAQGSFYFMSLSTGWVLNRLRTMALPVHARQCGGSGSSNGMATESKPRATVQGSKHELTQ